MKSLCNASIQSFFSTIVFGPIFLGLPRASEKSGSALGSPSTGRTSRSAPRLLSTAISPTPSSSTSPGRSPSSSSERDSSMVASTMRPRRCSSTSSMSPSARHRGHGPSRQSSIRAGAPYRQTSVMAVVPEKDHALPLATIHEPEQDLCAAAGHGPPRWSRISPTMGRCHAGTGSHALPLAMGHHAGAGLPK